MQIRIATRASKLAITQSGHVRDMIKSVHPDADISFVKVSTKGDRDNTDFLHKVQSVGFFTSEVEKSLIDNKADVAVHSLKDLPTDITTGLTIAAIPIREQVCDVMISSTSAASINELPQNAKIGTSSLRRIAQLKHLRADFNCQPLRGNVESRVKKVNSGEYDAIIVAQAGINRLGMADQITQILDPQIFVPAPGQGALAIQTRTSDTELIEMLSKIDDHNARITTTFERLILSRLHGGCSIPLGVYSRIDGDKLDFIAVIANTDASKYVKKTGRIDLDEIEEMSETITKDLLNSGGKAILEELGKNP